MKRISNQKEKNSMITWLSIYRFDSNHFFTSLERKIAVSFGNHKKETNFHFCMFFFFSFISVNNRKRIGTNGKRLNEWHTNNYQLESLSFRGNKQPFPHQRRTSLRSPKSSAFAIFSWWTHFSQTWSPFSVCFALIFIIRYDLLIDVIARLWYPFRLDTKKLEIKRNHILNWNEQSFRWQCLLFTHQTHVTDSIKRR